MLKANKTVLITLVLTLGSLGNLCAQETQFAPDEYRIYEEARVLDYAEKVVENARATRESFSNERFVASGNANYWQEWQQLEAAEDQNPLWWSEQVLKEDL